MQPQARDQNSQRNSHIRQQHPGKTLYQWMMMPLRDFKVKGGNIMPEIGYTKETCIIVVDISTRLMGIIVDTVSEVLDITAKDIEPTPSLGSDIKTDIILGMGKIKGKVKILLDINRVLTFDELAIPA